MQVSGAESKRQKVVPPWVRGLQRALMLRLLGCNVLSGCWMERETRPSFRTLFEWKRGFRDYDVAFFRRREWIDPFNSKTEL